MKRKDSRRALLAIPCRVVIQHAERVQDEEILDEDDEQVGRSAFWTWPRRWRVLMFLGLLMALLFAVYHGYSQFQVPLIVVIGVGIYAMVLWMLEGGNTIPLPDQDRDRLYLHADRIQVVQDNRSRDFPLAAAADQGPRRFCLPTEGHLVYEVYCDPHDGEDLQRALQRTLAMDRGRPRADA